MQAEFKEAEIKEMTIAHYGQMLELWNGTAGLALSEADSQANIANFLQRNPALSFVCESDGRVIGTSLCGHDGRRGFLYHVTVDEAHRGKGIAGKLVERSLDGLKAEGIGKCHLFTLEANELGSRYWSRTGWQRRSGILLYSRDLS